VEILLLLLPHKPLPDQRCPNGKTNIFEWLMPVSYAPSRPFSVADAEVECARRRLAAWR